MNAKEVFKKITTAIGQIMLNGKPMTELEFEKQIPTEIVEKLSDQLEEMTIPVTLTDDEFYDTGGSMTRLTQDDIRNIPVVVEIVAVPSFFDVDLHLSMRESTGMFDGKETYLEHVKFIAESIKASPYLILAKTPEMTVQSAFFCLNLFQELGLSVDSNDSEAMVSKFRGRSWKSHSKDWDFLYEPGHIAQQAYLIVIINLYKLVEDGILKKVEKSIAKIRKTSDKLEENMKMLEN